jgi:hypothetical protein
MKKIFFLLLMVVLMPMTKGWAADLSESQKWIEQVDGGFVFPVSPDVSKVFTRGVGGDILIGYRFDRNFSLATDIGYYDCDQNTPAGAADGEWIYVPIMEVARYNFGEGWIRPYVLLGLGAAYNTYSQTPGSLATRVSKEEVDFFLAPGAGFLFVVAKDTALYFQTRLDMDFVGNGVLGSPAADHPTLFIPIKGGISFFVL